MYRGMHKIYLPRRASTYRGPLLSFMKSKGCGARRLFALAVVLMLTSVAWSVSAGESSVITINDNFRAYRYQPLPGDLDYDDIQERPVWSSGTENISTAVLCADLDEDGVNELVFGTDEGRLVAVTLGTWFELVNEVVVEGGEVQSLAIGNLDDDEELEIALTSNEGVHCFDMSKEKVTWDKDYQTFDSDLVLVPAPIEDGEKARSDVLVLRTKGTALAGTEHYVIRLDGDGSEIYKTQLQELEDRPALHAAWVVADLDRDNDLDVFVSDRGRAGIGASGPGKNVWLVEANNGSVAGAWVIRHATLASRPLLVGSQGWKYVAVGMEQGLGTADNNDLVMFDGLDRSFQYMDVYPNDQIMAWQYLTFVPDAVSGTIVMATGDWRVHAFHLLNANQTWTHEFSGAGLANIPIACDIDDDGREELLCPGGGITYIDVISGEVEGRYEMERGTPIQIVMTVGDVDGDEVSETVFGYHESQTTDVYTLLVLGHLDVPGPEPPVSALWGWVLILVVIGANLALFYNLYFTYRKGRGEEEE